ncbi:alpha/beta hydrolase family protein [Erythrobacter sp. HA6-11]
MKSLKAPLVAAMVGVSALGLTMAPASPAEAQQAAEPIPVDVWSLRSVVNAVQVSPDGKHVLVHKLESKEGEYLMEIYSTDDMTKPLRRLNADPMEIIQARWVSDNYIFGTAWDVVRKRVTRPEEDIRSYKAFAYSLDSNKFAELPGNFGLVNLLPNEPDTILIGSGNAIPDPTGVDPFAAFRPRAYYRFNLERGSRQLVIKGNEKHPTIQFDNDGNPRISTRINPTSNVLEVYHRMPGESSWGDPIPALAVDFDEQANLYRVLSGIHGVQGFKEDNPAMGYVIENRNGDDKAALWEFNFETNEWGEKIVQAEDGDIMGMITHTVPGNNKLVGAVYPGARYEVAWLDEEHAALHAAFLQQIPYAHQVSITSRSRDGNTMIVRNVGPRDPGSFWLVKDGRMAKLGSRNPLLNPEQLPDVEYIRYTARDGLEIPAYVVKPKGEGPFPLVVQHNGGPHVNNVVTFDDWSMMLANNGYMVLRPQNRISTGWGQKHFDAGYGEHGLAMQDDKDDGVKYLIDQGLVDPDRVAFFGWSYGGYAALVAAAREDNLYQCTIAGAAVADAEKQYKGRRSPDAPKALDEWSKRRGMIGINPINEVDKVNIPVLMIHPDDDRRVMYYHYEDYKKAFEKAGKNGQFVTIEGADHFSNTHMFTHKQQVNTKILDYLKNDCGPGGL